jgi:hypothetical protein
LALVQYRCLWVAAYRDKEVVGCLCAFSCAASAHTGNGEIGTVYQI